jgi:hypothetical protein
MRVILLAVVCLTARASAETCKDDAAWTRETMQQLQQVAFHAQDAVLTCGFHGPNDKLLAKLGAEIRQVFRPLFAGQAAHKSCKLQPTGLTASDIGERYGFWAEQQLGDAVRQCSTKLRARVAQLEKQGKSDAELEAAAGLLAQEWFQKEMGK